MNAPGFAAGSDFIRRTCADVVYGAVRAGICGPQEAWHMTPEELSALIEARSKSEARRLRLIDTLAWLVGQYVAVAVNSPGRYPRRPDRVREKVTGEADMKKVFLKMAAGGGAGGK